MFGHRDLSTLRDSSLKMQGWIRKQTFSPGNEKVLRRFYRLDRSRNTPGTGLGLALVAAVARLHDGRLELRDGPGGRGLTVVLDLSATGKAQPSSGAPPRGASPGTLKILS